MLPLNLRQQLLYPQKERCCALRRRVVVPSEGEMLYPQKERCCNLRRRDIETSEEEMLYPQKKRCCTLRRRDVAPSEGEMNKCLEVATSNIRSVEKIRRKNMK